MGITRTSSFARPESPILGSARVCVIAGLLLAFAPSPVLAQNGGARFQNHNFQPGDRIIVVTRGDSTTVDTLTVQGDRTVSLQKLPPISLDGVLRSDVQSYLGQQVRQYVKRDVVSATPLVSLGVLGEVVHPGYYRVPLQITVSDLLMVAGGPSPQADLTHVRVRRGQSTLIDEHAIRDAMVRRLPLAELGIDAGDEVILKPAPQKNWLLIAQLAGIATGIALTLHTLKVF
jgi:protein involved in polysaccharide export with SLBB domain